MAMTQGQILISATIKALQDIRDYAEEAEAARLTIAIELLLDLLEEQDDKGTKG